MPSMRIVLNVNLSVRKKHTYKVSQASHIYQYWTPIYTTWLCVGTVYMGLVLHQASDKDL